MTTWPYNNLRHGHTGKVYRSPTYKSWQAMRERCTNPGKDGYERYGGRGIRCCERWAKFETFLADMGQRPADAKLERIDNEGHYEPGNCRWATAKEHARGPEHDRVRAAEGRREGDR